MQSRPHQNIGRRHTLAATRRTRPLLPRLHLIEFCESTWVPEFIRHGIVGALGLLLRLTGVYRRIFPDLLRWAHGADEILDLGSGSASHIEELSRYLQQHPELGSDQPRVLLSDLSPDVKRLQRVVDAAPGRVDFLADPVDATSVPSAQRRKLRCMFTAFHHLRPDQARELLLDASRHADGIFVVEPTRRTPLNLLANLLGIPFGMVAPLVMRPLSGKRLLFSTVIPLIPILLALDGIVSVLRSYSEAEVRAMIESLPPSDFSWQIKQLPGPGLLAPLSIMLIIGRRTHTV